MSKSKKTFLERLCTKILVKNVYFEINRNTQVVDVKFFCQYGMVPLATMRIVNQDLKFTFVDFKISSIPLSDPNMFKRTRKELKTEMNAKKLMLHTWHQMMKEDDRQLDGND